MTEGVGEYRLLVSLADILAVSRLNALGNRYDNSVLELFEILYLLDERLVVENALRQIDKIGAVAVLGS